MQTARSQRTWDVCKTPESWTLTLFCISISKNPWIGLSSTEGLNQMSSLTLKPVHSHKLRLIAEVLFQCEIDSSAFLNLMHVNITVCSSAYTLPPFYLSHKDNQINSFLQVQKKNLNSSFVVLLAKMFSCSTVCSPLYLPPHFSKTVCYCLKRKKLYRLF